MRDLNLKLFTVILNQATSYLTSSGTPRFQILALPSSWALTAATLQPESWEHLGLLSTSCSPAGVILCIWAPLTFSFCFCSYVAPEYASTGMLNERSDVYSFGILIMEIISGRNPVDYGRPPEEVCIT